MSADLSGVVESMLSASRAERDELAWRMCAEVARAVDASSPPEARRAYLPAAFPGMGQPWGPKQDQMVNACRGARDWEALRLAVSVDPDTFGRFRSAVLDHEAHEAAKLNPLLWSLQVLYRLADSGAFDGRLAARMSQGLSSVVEHEWRCGDWDVRGDTWAVATRATRSYRLVPKAWRSI